MRTRPSVMQHRFSEVPNAEIPRSTFDRSHGHKTTFSGGEIIPIYVDEALPGDTFKMKGTVFVRMATPIFPIMDNLMIDVHFFAVPNRLVWDNWRKFMGERDNPEDSIDYLIPTTTPDEGGFGYGSLFDYLGIPPDVENIEVSALFPRAYNLIWNEWYRDQNMQEQEYCPKDDGPDTANNYSIQRRGKRHDYFTSALPWPQKGDSVSLSLGGTAPISGTDFIHTGDGSPPTFGSNSGVLGDNSGNVIWTTTPVSATYFADPHLTDHDVSTLTADLTAATAVTINALRQATQIQKLLERDARGGTRYIELVKAHFGVTSPDLRAIRPIYLGGGSAPVNITPIPQTSATDGTSPQGNLAAFATAALDNMGFVSSFTEHCIILGLASVRADLTYQNGIQRMFSRQTRYDFYWPALAHIGEQAILNKEIFCDGSATDDDVFGYQERYAEYRYHPSQISSYFRSNHPQTLDSWHLSQNFEEVPALNHSFIIEDPPLGRVMAVNDPFFYMDAYFQLHCTRPMPIYGVPGLLDHF